jgi:hypothetical protein
MAFRAKLRHRWRSWLAIAVLISVVGASCWPRWPPVAGRRRPSRSSSPPTALTAMSTPPGQSRKWPSSPGSRLPSNWSALTPVSRCAPAPTRSTRRTFGVIFALNGAIAVQARLGPLARSVGPGPGVGVVHAAAGLRGAPGERDPRPVLRAVAGCGVQRRHWRRTQAHRSDRRLPRGRVRSERIRVPFRGDAFVRPLHHLGVRKDGDPAHACRLRVPGQPA